VTADAQGNWRRDLTSGVDILGGDQIEVLFVNASGDLIRQSSIVPYMTITNGHDHVTGVGARDVLVTIKLKRHGSTVGIGHGWTVDTPIDGSLVLGGAPRGGAEFRVLLADGSGMAAYPRPGDVVVGSFAPDARLRMPSIFVEGDMSTEMIHGRCLPSTTFWLSIYDQGIRLLSTNGDTAPDGSFDFSAGFFGDDIGPLASVYVECIAPRGDRVATWGGVTP
jgi:hypothetical protein